MRMIPAVGTGALAAFVLSAMPGCASLGEPYPKVVGETGAPPQGHARIVLLRPDQRFDDASLSRVVIRVNDEVLGKLAYGGFLFADVDENETVMEASARNRWFGSCKLRVTAKAGDTIYVDVAPRPVNIAAGLVGAVAGAAVVGGVGAGHAGMDEILVEKGAAEVAAASTAGGAAVNAIESAGKECGGPYRLKLVAASTALESLERLRWSR
jgi:hypothetical protein